MKIFIKVKCQITKKSYFLCLHRLDSVRCLQQAERLGDGLLRVNALAWPPVLPPDSLTHLSTLVALRKQLDDKKTQVLLLLMTCH